MPPRKLPLDVAFSTSSSANHAALISNLTTEGFADYLAANHNTPSKLDCQAVASACSRDLFDWTSRWVSPLDYKVASITYTSEDDPTNTKPPIGDPEGIPNYSATVKLTATITRQDGSFFVTPQLPPITYCTQYIPDRDYYSRWFTMARNLGEELTKKDFKPASMRVLVSKLLSREGEASLQLPGGTLSDSESILTLDLDKSYVTRVGSAVGNHSSWNIEVDIRGPLYRDSEDTNPAIVHRGTASWGIVLHDEMYDPRKKKEEEERGWYQTFSQLGLHSRMFDLFKTQ